MIIYEIKLPKKQDPGVFANFMQKEYFPAVFRGPTRVGQVTDLLLLQGMAETGDSKMPHHFYWQVGWNGLGGGKVSCDNIEIQQKFEAFKPTIKRIGMFEQVASQKKK